MSDQLATFTHMFGGWHKADARRWRNPDGSEGGIVALSASVHDSVRLPVSVEVWPDAKIVEGVASIGDGASIGKDDWWGCAGPQGSRDAFTTWAWSREHGLRWLVGCKYGITSDDLRALVAETHGTSDHAADYLHLIASVEGHPGLKRAMTAVDQAPTPAGE